MSESATAKIIADLPQETILSMYQAAQYLEEVHGEAVRPQMMYNYGKKGYIPTVEGSEGKKVTIGALAEWYEAYATRKANRMAKKAAEVKADLNAK